MGLAKQAWHFAIGVGETSTHHVMAAVGFAGGISEIGVRVLRLTWSACNGQTGKKYILRLKRILKRKEKIYTKIKILT